MNIVAWLVVRDDAYYVGMAIKSIVSYVDALYVQDQNSKDKTLDVILENVGKTPIWVDRVDTGLPRFDKNYNEPLYRSLAIARCEAQFKPEFLLQLDADEIYTSHFFERLKHLPEGVNGVRHATERFITPIARSQSPHALQNVDGKLYYDPHTRFWRAGRGVRYIKNPTVEGYLHCILNSEPNPIFWIPGLCHIHLHRSFGPKAFDWWKQGGDIFEETKPFNPKRQAPKWFNSELNMGTALTTEFDWPDYVLNKWKDWGNYE